MRRFALTVALMTVLSGCGGSEGGSDAEGGGAGRLLVQTLDEFGAPVGLSTMEPDGRLVDEIDPDAYVDDATVLGDGTVLVELDDRLLIVDVETGESTPIQADTEPENGIESFSLQESGVVPVSQAGSWLLLGGRGLGELLLVDVETGRATLLADVVQAPIKQASLDASGEHVTVVGSRDVAELSTDDPGTVRTVLEGKATSGSIRSDGDLVAYTGGGSVWQGAPGAEPEPVDVTGAATTAFVGEDLLVGGDGRTTVVDARGEATPLSGEPVERVMVASTFAVLVRGDEAVRVPLDDLTDETPLPGVADQFPVRGSRPDQKELALFPTDQGSRATTMTVVGPTGAARAIEEIGSFLPTAPTRIAGDRVLVGNTDGPRPTTTVLDIESATILATSPWVPARAFAPDGSSVTVRSPDATGSAKTLPLDGSDPVDLGHVQPWAWGPE